MCWSVGRVLIIFSGPIIRFLLITWSRLPLLLTRACVKKTPLLYMNSIQDMTEGYSSLRHLTGFLEKEMFTYSHLGICEKGAYHRIFSGREVCLADNETAEEWRWLAKRWAFTLSDDPSGC